MAHSSNSFNSLTKSKPPLPFICHSLNQPLHFQSIFVNDHQPLLKTDYKRILKQPVEIPDPKILKPGNSLFNFLSNVLGEEFVVGEQTLNPEKYNMEQENNFECLRKVLGTFRYDEQVIDLYHAQ